MKQMLKNLVAIVMIVIVTRMMEVLIIMSGVSFIYNIEHISFGKDG